MKRLFTIVFLLLTLQAGASAQTSKVFRGIASGMTRPSGHKWGLAGGILSTASTNSQHTQYQVHTPIRISSAAARVVVSPPVNIPGQFRPINGKVNVQRPKTGKPGRTQCKRSTNVKRQAIKATPRRN